MYRTKAAAGLGSGWWNAGACGLFTTAGKQCRISFGCYRTFLCVPLTPSSDSLLHHTHAVVGYNQYASPCIIKGVRWHAFCAVVSVCRQQDIMPFTEGSIYCTSTRRNLSSRSHRSRSEIGLVRSTAVVHLLVLGRAARHDG